MPRSTRSSTRSSTFAEMERFIDTPVKRYSSGMFLRLAFSVAAHLNPAILLVDEVLAVGDVRFREKCLARIGEVSHEGRTVHVREPRPERDRLDVLAGTAHPWRTPGARRPCPRRRRRVRGLGARTRIVGWTVHARSRGPPDGHAGLSLGGAPGRSWRRDDSVLARRPARARHRHEPRGAGAGLLDRLADRRRAPTPGRVTDPRC